MDNAKVPNDFHRNDSGDIDIFLFSNGQIFSPPRKYHLTAEELDIWDSTVKALARSHYGYTHSAIDLYTIEGKKVENPYELDTNNAYVAVEPNDVFLPGGYDQYLMKASKSWIKRYGSISSHTSKEKLNGANAAQTEKPTSNSNVDKVQETSENTTVTTADFTSAEINKSDEVPGTTMPQMQAKHNSKLKQIEKKKPLVQRSSILRKNNSQLQTNDKKPIPPQKRRPGSPPKKMTVNKISSQTLKKDTQPIKTLYSPLKLKNGSSHQVLDNISLRSTNVTPELVVPAKLSIKSEIQNELDIKKESSMTITKPREKDVDVMKQMGITTNDVVREVSTKEVIENKSGKKNSKTLETIIENVNSFYSVEPTKITNDDTTEPYSTVIKLGDVMHLRLSIEVNNNTTETRIHKNADVTIPLKNYNEGVRKHLTEKSNQANIDEIGVQNKIVDNILDDLNMNEAQKKYVILYCNCCHNYFHGTAAWPDDAINDHLKNKQNKDYVILLPTTKHDENQIGCKCDDAPSKSDKYVQTSMIFKNACPSLEHIVKITDQTTNPDETFNEVNNNSHLQTDQNVCNVTCGKIVNNENTLYPKENQIFYNDCQTYDKCIENNLEQNQLSPTKDNKIINTEYQDCGGMTKENVLEKVMLDKSTQTNSHCLLLEARRQKDGHFSFHLPPLHIVKLYQT